MVNDVRLVTVGLDPSRPFFQIPQKVDSCLSR